VLPERLVIILPSTPNPTPSRAENPDHHRFITAVTSRTATFKAEVRDEINEDPLTNLFQIVAHSSSEDIDTILDDLADSPPPLSTPPPIESDISLCDPYSYPPWRQCLDPDWQANHLLTLEEENQSRLLWANATKEEIHFYYETHSPVTRPHARFILHRRFVHK